MTNFAKSAFFLFISSFGFSSVAQTTTAEEVPTLTPEQQEQQYYTWANELWNSLDKQQGKIYLPSANAELQVPENFIYLNPKDTEKVLVDAWGNMPNTEMLGMLMPSNVTAFDDGSWAVTIEYSEDGYVSDEDAAEIDYDDLLEEVKSDTKAASKDRIQQGYESIEMIGWASDPYYDQVNKKMHWAKEIKFGESTENTLNYNIRILGRKGVLVLNFIANMDQKDLINAKLPEVLAIAQFEQGNQYADFNPDTDNYAAYGLGALITGKVLAKTGFFAIALVFLKKFGVFILVGAATLLGGFFKQKKKTKDE